MYKNISILGNKVRKLRKISTCGNCNRSMSKGEKFRVMFGIHNGKNFEFKYCGDCCYKYDGQRLN